MSRASQKLTYFKVVVCVHVGTGMHFTHINSSCRWLLGGKKKKHCFGLIFGVGVGGVGGGGRP